MDPFLDGVDFNQFWNALCSVIKVFILMIDAFLS